MRQLCLTALQNSSISNYCAPQEQVVEDGGFFGGLYLKHSTQNSPRAGKAQGTLYMQSIMLYAIHNGNFLLPD